jgi:hypothetical protein
MEREKSDLAEPLRKGITRRSLLNGLTRSTVGAGLLLGSGVGLQASSAQADGDGNAERCRPLARPIPHITGPGHFFFAGPPDGSAPPSFPNYPNAGFDPSTVTDFQGVIANCDVIVDGTGTDLKTGVSVPYQFHADWRFYQGQFVAIDGIERLGTLTFI